MKNTISFLLITFGTIGATIGVAHTNLQVEGWESSWQVDSAWFITSLLVMLVGIFLKHAGKSKLKTAPMREGNRSNLENALNLLLEQIKQIDQGAENDSLDQLHQKLEETVSGPLYDFVENRQSLIDDYGIAGYALVMSPFARGERYVNRAWSASADGYFEEAVNYIKRSIPAFTETMDILQQQKS